MEFHGGGSGGIVVSGSNVPAFLTKLWTLVEDPETDPLICWSPNGTSFHVFDQGRFSKEVLPKFFKHNNMASFVRQLNMYGFRKVVHIEQGGLVKPEKDDTEFQHPFFIRGQDNLLENIKRKVTNITTLKQEELKISSDEVNKILTDVQHMKGKQENMDSKIIAMKHENAALWREVASLRQKHSQQQKVVNKLIHFLVTLVQSNRVLGMKRKIPLMLNDSSSAHSLPKFSRQYSLESSPAAISAPGATFSAASLYSADSPLTSGPVISDITDLAADIPIEVTSDWIQDRTSPLVLVKEEPTSPVVEEVCPPLEGSVTPVDTPLSPTTFFHSILQESSENNGNAPLCTPPSTPGPAPTTSDSAPQPEEQRCLSVACIDKTELHEHLEHIDNSLENLQSILNAQTINFDSSPLYEFFSNSLPSSDFDLDSLDTIQDLLSDSPRGPESSQNFNRSGKQLMQYAATPMLTTEPISVDQGGADLPTLLELEGDTYFTTEDPPEEDPTISLLTSTFNDPNTQS